jgi:hypothetical protein
MSNGKINEVKMMKLLNAGKSQADVARELDVSPAAISLRKKELLGKTTRVMVTKKNEKITNSRDDGPPLPPEPDQRSEFDYAGGPF